MVTLQKEVHYREGICHLELTHKTKTDQVTTVRNSHLPPLGWLPTNPRMVTDQKEVNYRHGIWHSDLTYQNNTR